MLRLPVVAAGPRQRSPGAARQALLHSPVGAGLIERLHFADNCASPWLDCELTELEDQIMQDAARDIRSHSHALTIASDGLQTRRRIVA